MDKFYQIITELWPLIEVQNCVLLNIIFCGGVSCLHAELLFSAVFHPILFKLAGSNDMHKSSQEFEIKHNWTTGCGVSCPLASKKIPIYL